MSKNLCFLGAALAIAAISLAFMTNTKKITCPSSTSYVWFPVKSGIGKTCPNFTSIIPSDLLWHVRSTNNPLGDMAEYIITQTDASSILYFNCPKEETYTCAVGYAAVATEFESVTIGGQNYWRPKGTAIELCAICRPTMLR